jgi:3-methylcrotonyl-CoA carboxylase alpha subunit
VRLDGHAVEARLYAEDPERGFLPSTGRLVALSFPEGEGLRIDSGVEAGDIVTPFYDPMIAKATAHGGTRDIALDRLAEALEATVIAGPRSNTGFLAALARADGFRQGDFDTGFIDRNMVALGATPQGIDCAAVAAGARALVAREQTRNTGDGASPWDMADGFQLSGARRLALPVTANGEAVVAQVEYGVDGRHVSVMGDAPAEDAAVIAAPDAIYVLRKGRQTKVTLRDLAIDQGSDAGSGGVVRAPMHGKVLAILVEAGAKVARGQRVAIIEAMKMEHTLTAPIDGTVSEITAAKGAQVPEGAKVLTVEPSPQS